MCGSGLGAFFYSPTCQFLIDNLSLQSSVCILALFLTVTSLFCGALQTPLEHVISLVVDESEEKLLEEASEPKESKLNDNESNNSKSEEKLDQPRRNSRVRKNNLYVPTDFGLKGRKNGQRTISECVAPNLAALEPNLKHYESATSDANSKSTYMYRSKNSLIFKQQDLFYSGSTLHLQPQSILNIAQPNKPNKLNLDDNISNIVTVKKEVPNSVYQTIKGWWPGNVSKLPVIETHTEEKERKMTSVQDEEESAIKIVKEMLDYRIFKESSSYLLLTIANFASMLVGYF